MTHKNRMKSFVTLSKKRMKISSFQESRNYALNSLSIWKNSSGTMGSTSLHLRKKSCFIRDCTRMWYSKVTIWAICNSITLWLMSKFQLNPLIKIVSTMTNPLLQKWILTSPLKRVFLDRLWMSRLLWKSKMYGQNPWVRTVNSRAKNRRKGHNTQVLVIKGNKSTRNRIRVST